MSVCFDFADCWEWEIPLVIGLLHPHPFHQYNYHTHMSAQYQSLLSCIGIVLPFWANPKAGLFNEKVLFSLVIFKHKLVCLRASGFFCNEINIPTQSLEWDKKELILKSSSFDEDDNKNKKLMKR